MQDICGPAEKEFFIDHRNKPKWKFTIQLGDEAIIAPLSLFHTELLNITGTGKMAKTQKPARQQPDPEDCFDAEYLRETGVYFIDNKYGHHEHGQKIQFLHLFFFLVEKKCPRTNGTECIGDRWHDEYR